MLIKDIPADLAVLLNRDLQKNIACIGFFSNYPVSDFFIKNDSAVIFGKSDHLWAHISSSSVNDLSTLLETHHKITKYYFSVEDWMIPLILYYGEAKWIMSTNRFILSSNIEIDPSNEKIVPINKSLASYIYENSDYQEFTSIEYIKDRLRKDISAGIWKENKLIAWGFTHDDGALGSLHVVNTHRNKGLAKAILSHLIKERRKENKSVFANIIPDNIPAIKLVEKIGFVFDRRVSWIKLRE